MRAIAFSELDGSSTGGMSLRKASSTVCHLHNRFLSGRNIQGQLDIPGLAVRKLSQNRADKCADVLTFSWDCIVIYCNLIIKLRRCAKGITVAWLTACLAKRYNAKLGQGIKLL